MFIRAQVIGGAVLLGVGFATAWLAQGWRYGGKIAAIEKDMANAVAVAHADARRKEQDYAKLNARVDGQYLELAAAQLEAADLRAAVAAGTQRLSVRTLDCGVSKDTRTARVDNETVRADINPRDAAGIIAILSRGDDAIRQLTALQDWAVGVSASQ